MGLELEHDPLPEGFRPCRALVLALALTIAGCAHQGGGTKRSALRDARTACARLAQPELKVPIQTQVKPVMDRIKATRRAGKRRKAAAMARRLYLACVDEADKRENLAPIVEIVEKDRSAIDPQLYAHFQSLVMNADYARAILCGEGIMQRNPENCGFLPSQARRAGSTVTLRAGDNSGQKSTTLSALPAPRGTDPAAPGSPGVPASSSRSTLAEGSAARSTGPAAAELDAPAGSDENDKSEEEAGGAGSGGVDRSMSPRRLWAWILMGSGAGLLAGGGIMAGLAQAKYNELEETCPYCYQRDIDAGKRRAITADILFGVGGAALVTGAVLMIWDLKARPKKDSLTSRLPRLSISPTSLSITGRY